MEDNPDRALAKTLVEIARTHMPFGKFGPASFPPAGVPIYDLPYEYLAYFERKGFPSGKLGELLRYVYLAKRDGADAVFDPIRAIAGGRTSLRQPKRRHWAFDGKNGQEFGDEAGGVRENPR